jgi:hypothetical protein
VDLMDIHMPADLLIGGELMYSDSRHLSGAGESRFGPRYVEALRQEGLLLDVLAN